MRQIVTGRDIDGRSVLIADVDLAETPKRPTGWIADLWGSDGIISLPSVGVRPPYSDFFPPPQGFRVKVICFGPEEPSDGIPEAASAAVLDSIPYAKFEGAGVHTTETIDVGYVLEGEIDLELDDGAVVHLMPGDTYVQNGTRHSWHNRTNSNCILLVALIGAQPQEGGGGSGQVS
jgi:hypothetical protein